MDNTHTYEYKPGAGTRLPETRQPDPYESFNKILTRNIHLNRYSEVLQENKTPYCSTASDLWCKSKKNTHMLASKNITYGRLKYPAWKTGPKSLNKHLQPC